MSTWINKTESLKNDKKEKNTKKKLTKQEKEKSSILFSGSNEMSQNSTVVSNKKKRKLTLSMCLGSRYVNRKMKKSSSSKNAKSTSNVNEPQIVQNSDAIGSSSSLSDGKVSDSELVVISEADSYSSERMSPFLDPPEALSNCNNLKLNKNGKKLSPVKCIVSLNELHSSSFDKKSPSTVCDKLAPKKSKSNISVLSGSSVEIRENDKHRSYQSTFSPTDMLPEIEINTDVDFYGPIDCEKDLHTVVENSDFRTDSNTFYEDTLKVNPEQSIAGGFLHSSAYLSPKQSHDIKSLLFNKLNETKDSKENIICRQLKIEPLIKPADFNYDQSNFFNFVIDISMLKAANNYITENSSKSENFSVISSDITIGKIWQNDSMKSSDLSVNFTNLNNDLNQVNSEDGESEISISSCKTADIQPEFFGVTNCENLGKVSENFSNNLNNYSSENLSPTVDNLIQSLDLDIDADVNEICKNQSKNSLCGNADLLSEINGECSVKVSHKKRRKKRNKWSRKKQKCTKKNEIFCDTCDESELEESACVSESPKYCSDVEKCIDMRKLAETSGQLPSNTFSSSTSHSVFGDEKLNAAVEKSERITHSTKKQSSKIIIAHSEVKDSEENLTELNKEFFYTFPEPEIFSKGVLEKEKNVGVDSCFEISPLNICQSSVISRINDNDKNLSSPHKKNVINSIQSRKRKRNCEKNSGSELNLPDKTENYIFNDVNRTTEVCNKTGNREFTKIIQCSDNSIEINANNQLKSKGSCRKKRFNSNEQVEKSVCHNTVIQNKNSIHSDDFVKLHVLETDKEHLNKVKEKKLIVELQRLDESILNKYCKMFNNSLEQNKCGDNSTFENNLEQICNMDTDYSKYSCLNSYEIAEHLTSLDYNLNDSCDSVKCNSNLFLQEKNINNSVSKASGSNKCSSHSTYEACSCNGIHSLSSKGNCQDTSSAPVSSPRKQLRNTISSCEMQEVHSSSFTSSCSIINSSMLAPQTANQDFDINEDREKNSNSLSSITKLIDNDSTRKTFSKCQSSDVNRSPTSVKARSYSSKSCKSKDNSYSELQSASIAEGVNNIGKPSSNPNSESCFQQTVKKSISSKLSRNKQNSKHCEKDNIDNPPYLESDLNGSTSKTDQNLNSEKNIGRRKKKGDHGNVDSATSSSKALSKKAKATISVSSPRKQLRDTISSCKTHEVHSSSFTSSCSINSSLLAPQTVNQNFDINEDLEKNSVSSKTKLIDNDSTRKTFSKCQSSDVNRSPNSVKARSSKSSKSKDNSYSELQSVLIAEDFGVNNIGEPSVNPNSESCFQQTIKKSMSSKLSQNKQNSKYCEKDNIDNPPYLESDLNGSTSKTDQNLNSENNIGRKKKKSDHGNVDSATSSSKALSKKAKATIHVKHTEIKTASSSSEQINPSGNNKSLSHESSSGKLKVLENVSSLFVDPSKEIKSTAVMQFFENEKCNAELNKNNNSDVNFKQNNSTPLMKKIDENDLDVQTSDMHEKGNLKKENSCEKSVKISTVTSSPLKHFNSNKLNEQFVNNESCVSKVTEKNFSSFCLNTQDNVIDCIDTSDIKSQNENPSMKAKLSSFEKEKHIATFNSKNEENVTSEVLEYCKDPEETIKPVSFKAKIVPSEELNTKCKNFKYNNLAHEEVSQSKNSNECAKKKSKGVQKEAKGNQKESSSVSSNKINSKCKVKKYEKNEFSKSLQHSQILCDTEKKEEKKSKVSDGKSSIAKYTLTKLNSKSISPKRHGQISVMQNLKDNKNPEMLDFTLPPNTNCNLNNKSAYKNIVKNMKPIPKLSSKERTEKKSRTLVNVNKEFQKESADIQCPVIQISKFENNVHAVSFHKLNEDASDLINLVEEDLDFEPDQFGGKNTKNSFNNNDIESSHADINQENGKITASVRRQLFNNMNGRSESSLFSGLSTTSNDNVVSNNDKDLDSEYNLSLDTSTLPYLNYNSNFRITPGRQDLPSEDSDSDNEHSFKRYRSERKDIAGESSANSFNLKLYEENPQETNCSIRNETILNYKSDPSGTNENCHLSMSSVTSSSKSDSSKLCSEDQTTDELNNDQASVSCLKSKVSTESATHLKDVVARIKDCCEKGLIADAIQMAETYIAISSSHDVNKSIILGLLSSTFSFILKSDKKKFIFKMFDDILKLIHDFDMCNKHIASYFIKNCCSHSDLCIYSIKLFHLCQEKHIPLKSDAVNAFSALLKSEKTSLPVLLDFLKYVKSVCNKKVSKDLVHLALEKCNAYKILDISLMCSFLHKVTTKEVEETNLIDFLKLCFKKKLWQYVAEIFFAWDIKNALSICIYTALAAEYETIGKYFKKFADSVHGQGRSVHPELKDRFGQIGTALMLSAFSKNHLKSALEVLLTLHTYNVNYFEFQLAVGNFCLPQSCSDADSYDLKVFPFSVVFIAIDICLHFNRPKDAFTIFQGFSWVTQHENLDEEAKKYVINERYQRLLKLVPLLNSKKSLHEGWEALENLLTTIEQDISEEVKQKSIKDIHLIYNKYLIRLLNAGKISSVYSLYQHSLGPRKDICVMVPNVLRGLIVAFSHHGMSHVANSLFLFGIIRKVYFIQKPELESFPWKITLMTHWTVAEIKFAIEWFIETLFPLLMDKPKETNFEKWFSIKIVFKVMNNFTSKIQCLMEEAASDSKHYVTKTIDALQSMNPSLQVSEVANESALCITSDSLYNFWKNKYPDASLNFSSMDRQFLEPARKRISFGSDGNCPDERESVSIQLGEKDDAMSKTPENALKESRHSVESSQELHRSAPSAESVLFELIDDIRANTSDISEKIKETNTYKQHTSNIITQTSNLNKLTEVPVSNELYKSPKETVKDHTVSDIYKLSPSKNEVLTNTSHVQNPLKAINSKSLPLSSFLKDFSTSTPKDSNFISNKSPRTGTVCLKAISSFTKSNKSQQEKNTGKRMKKISLVKQPVAQSSAVQSTSCRLKKLNVISKAPGVKTSIVSKNMTKSAITSKLLPLKKKRKVSNPSSKKFENLTVCFASNTSVRTVSNTLLKNESLPAISKPIQNDVMMGNNLSNSREKVGLSIVEKPAQNSETDLALAKLSEYNLEEQIEELQEPATIQQKALNITSSPVDSVSNDAFTNCACPVDVPSQNSNIHSKSSKLVIRRNFNTEINKDLSNISPNKVTACATILDSTSRASHALEKSERMTDLRNNFKVKRIFNKNSVSMSSCDSTTWDSKEFNKAIRFLKVKIKLKNNNLSPSEEDARALTLAKAFISNNAVISNTLDKKTMKLLQEYADIHA